MRHHNDDDGHGLDDHLGDFNDDLHHHLDNHHHPGNHNHSVVDYKLLDANLLDQHNQPDHHDIEHHDDDHLCIDDDFLADLHDHPGMYVPAEVGGSCWHG